MAATLLAFSYNGAFSQNYGRILTAILHMNVVPCCCTALLVGIELIGGAPLPLQQQEDYLALWRYIGWLLGVDSKALDPCRDPVRRQCTLHSRPCVPRHEISNPRGSCPQYHAVLRN